MDSAHNYLNPLENNWGGKRKLKEQLNLLQGDTAVEIPDVYLKFLPRRGLAHQFWLFQLQANLRIPNVFLVPEYLVLVAATRILTIYFSLDLVSCARTLSCFNVFLDLKDTKSC